MSANLSPQFLADLAEVYAAMQPPQQAFSPTFLSDLKQVYDTLPVASDDNLLFLAAHFDKWRRLTKEFIRTHRAELTDDDPLKCPISLFRTMDLGRVETAHTRTLAWLLDRKGEHGFGDVLIAALLQRIAGPQTGALVVERVRSEHLTDGTGDQGRLDVVAEGAWQEKGERTGWVLVIEAKIDAREGEGQLNKYETWLRTHATGRTPYLVFLTPDGRSPETGEEEWESLSYLELVRVFRTVYSELRHLPGFHFLRFYLAGVLQDVCHFPRNISEDAGDPYAVAAYLKTVHDSPSEGASHDAAR